jgi:hypothetical protein
MEPVTAKTETRYVERHICPSLKDIASRLAEQAIEASLAHPRLCGAPLAGAGAGCGVVRGLCYSKPMIKVPTFLLGKPFQEGELEKISKVDFEKNKLYFAQQIIQKLQAQRVIGHSCPERVDHSLIFFSHFLKKRLKEDAIAYPEFITAYDLLVDRLPMFRLIRNLSKEIRQDPREVSSQLMMFLVLWGGEKFYQMPYESIKTFIEFNKRDVLEIIQKSRKKVHKISRQVFSLMGRGEIHRTLLHGTRLATLYCMRMSQTFELIPSGTLFNEGNPVFNGELIGSSFFENKNFISFSNSSKSFNDQFWKGRDSILETPTATFFLQSILYSLKKENHFGFSKTYGYDPKKDAEHFSNLLVNFRTELNLLFQSIINFQNDCSEENKIKLKECQTKFAGFIDYSTAVVLRKIALSTEDITDHIHDLRDNIYLFVIEKLESGLIDKNQSEFFRQLHRNFHLRTFAALNNSSKKHFKSSEAEELEYLQDQTPIIFGTHNMHPKKNIHGYAERLLSRHTPDFLLCLKKDRSRIQSVLGSSDIPVLDMRCIAFMETLIMLSGEHIRQLNLPRRLDLGSVMSDVQQALNDTLPIIIPYYATPLPEKPKADLAELSDDQKLEKMKEITNPYFETHFKEKMTVKCSYKDYIDQVKSLRSPARLTHGVVHMMRTVIFSQVFLRLSKPDASMKDIYLTAIAAAFHDSARQDEGEDRWDTQSAWNLRTFLNIVKEATTELEFDDDKTVARIWVQDEDIEVYYRSIYEKDGIKMGANPSIQKRIDEAIKAVHDADCMDIYRCVGDTFDQTKLKSYSEESARFVELIEACKRFIFETESLDWKVKLEYQSDHPYQDMLELLKKPEYSIIQTYL